MTGEHIILPEAMRAYDLIEAKAGSNVFVQGLSGVAGFPLTLAVDAGVIPAIYGRLWGELRAVYGHPPIASGDVKTVLARILPEVFTDLALDKFLGNVPLIGIYFNAICAKALTWRVGTLFTMLSSRGSEIPADGVAEAMRLIRLVFPQRDMFAFHTPDRQRFLDLVSGLNGSAEDDFARKVKLALDALRG